MGADSGDTNAGGREKCSEVAKIGSTQAINNMAGVRTNLKQMYKASKKIARRYSQLTYLEKNQT